MGARRLIPGFSRCFILVGSFLIASSAPAIADKDYPTSIISDPDSPVTLMKCEAWARDINKTILYSHASVPNMLSDLGISFSNNSDKTVTALRIEVSTYDITNAPVQPFGVPQHLDTDTNRSADKMAVSPGASLDLLGPRSWHPGYNIFQNSDHVSCEITAVRFADGTVWTAGSSPPSHQVAPTPGVSTPPSGSIPPRVFSPLSPGLPQTDLPLHFDVSLGSLPIDALRDRARTRGFRLEAGTRR